MLSENIASTFQFPELTEKSFDTLKPIAMLTIIRVEDIRRRQREEGYFDCFGRASSGYCDQTGCAYHAECIEISKAMPEQQSL